MYDNMADLRSSELCLTVTHTQPCSSGSCVTIQQPIIPPRALCPTELMAIITTALALPLFPYSSIVRDREGGGGKHVDVQIQYYSTHC